jgi:hypothetical protein
MNKPTQRFGSLFHYFANPIDLAFTSAITGQDVTPYVLSKKSISSCKCVDCGLNVIEAGDWYVCSHELWIGELDLRRDDNLCFDCLEDRLERPLRAYKDVHLAPRSVKGIKLSDRWHELFMPKRRRGRSHRRARGGVNSA